MFNNKKNKELLKFLANNSDQKSDVKAHTNSDSDNLKFVLQI